MLDKSINYKPKQEFWRDIAGSLTFCLYLQTFSEKF